MSIQATLASLIAVLHPVPSANARRWGVLLIPFALAACDAGARLRALREQPRTAHERYAKALREAGLQETGLGRDWLVAGDSVLRAPLDVTLPFREAGAFVRSEARAVGYRLSLSAGQRVTVAVRVEGRPLQLFVDLFEASGDSLRPLEHRVSAEPDSATRASAADAIVHPQTFTLTHEARSAGEFVVRVQPELLRDGRYRIELVLSPILAFPVEGHSNRAVQSFFGAERDAGRRVHHGIDIFAPRGTPVLAATDGLVRSITPNTLGGNVVWLSDVERGQSLYYAHLDRHHVQAGVRVRLGDTLGFVGNSGNARGTRPHLHFGIYRRGEGPIDPYPWVRRVVAEAPALVADTGRLGEKARTAGEALVLRRAPSPDGDTVRLLARRTPVRIVGAAGRWYRVELDDGHAGYVPARQTTPLTPQEAAQGLAATRPADRSPPPSTPALALPSPPPSNR